VFCVVCCSVVCWKGIICSKLVKFDYKSVLLKFAQKTKNKKTSVFGLIFQFCGLLAVVVCLFFFVQLERNRR
jgi:lipid-A-disaccharide synthase-like uncharacterized protein